MLRFRNISCLLLTGSFRAHVQCYIYLQIINIPHHTHGCCARAAVAATAGGRRCHAPYGITKCIIYQRAQDEGQRQSEGPLRKTPVPLQVTPDHPPIKHVQLAQY